MIGLMIGRPSLDCLHWDDWNRDHIAKHAVLPEEAEEVIAGLPKVSAERMNERKTARSHEPTQTDR